MQLNPRLLVNLLVKLTKNEYPNGGHGGGLPLCQFQGLGPGNTLGERLETSDQLPTMRL